MPGFRKIRMDMKPTNRAQILLGRRGVKHMSYWMLCNNIGHYRFTTLQLLTVAK